MTLKEFQTAMEELNRHAQHGCGDGSCQIRPPGGQHTNNRCYCEPRDFSRELLALAIATEETGRRWDKPI